MEIQVVSDFRCNDFRSSPGTGCYLAALEAWPGEVAVGTHMWQP